VSFHVAVALSSVLALIHWKAEHIKEQKLVDPRKLEDFAAGVVVSYVFVELLAEINAGAQLHGSLVFGLALGGFSVVHVAEEYIYSTEKNFRKDLRYLHTVFLTLYYFVIGIALEVLISTNLRSGLFLFSVVAIESGVSSLAVSELDQDLLQARWAKLLVSVSVLLGTVVSIVLKPGQGLYYLLFSPVIGMFFYVSIHDSLRPENRGNPESYIVGVAFFLSVAAAFALLL